MPRTSAIDSWEGYWRRTPEGAAHAAGGPQDEVLARFWTGFFAQALPAPLALRIADAGCGNGAVLGFALEAAARARAPVPSLVGIDLSWSAIADLRRRMPTVHGVVCDSRHPPFPRSSFDVVTSQFGLEYAGTSAFAAAARLVAPGGILAAVVHLKDGAIYRENVANLQSVAQLRESGLLAAAAEAFCAHDALRLGKASRAALRAAEAALEAAQARVGEMLGRTGPHVAGGVLQRLLDDVTHMARRRAAYDSQEAVRWAGLMAAEMDAYAERMSSMLQAAASDSDLEDMLRACALHGLQVRVRDKLLMGRVAEPGAWLVILRREAHSRLDQP